MTPTELLEWATRLTQADTELASGTWPRAVSILGRRALELSLDDLWQAQKPRMKECSTRAQLICLPRFLETGLAREVGTTWDALSRASHYHAYELPPTVAELKRWVETVAALIGAVGSEHAVESE
jgi:hypothetical protein